jgi:hypothetical protein
MIMAKSPEKMENLNSFSAYVDENGQNASDSPNEVGNAAELQQVLHSKPDGESETARIASGTPDDDGTAQTEAETPAETIDHISNPHIAGSESPIERATAALGKDK